MLPLSLVLDPVRVYENAVAMHSPVMEISDIFLRRPDKGPAALHLVIREIAFVPGSGSHHEHALPVPLASLFCFASVALRERQIIRLLELEHCFFQHRHFVIFFVALGSFDLGEALLLLLDFLRGGCALPTSWMLILFKNRCCFPVLCS